MKVQLLHTSDCHAWKTALDVLEEALSKGGHETHYEVILVATDEEAKLLEFLGSPTVRIDDIDVDPRARTVTNYGLAACRPYFYQGKIYDYPPKDLISEALKEVEQ